MAYAAISGWLDFSIRADGNNENGGAIISAADETYTRGVDRTLSATPYVAIGGGSVTAVCTTGGNRSSIILTNFSVSDDDLGNCVQIVTAPSGVFTGLYLISSVDTDANSWGFSKPCRDSTGDASALGITTANMGGAWGATGPGFYGSKQDVWFDDGQAFILWIRAGSYEMTSTSVNVAGGALQLTGASPSTIQGYTATPGDAIDGGDRPVIDVASTGFTGKMVDIAATSACEINDVILDGGGTATHGVYGKSSAVGDSAKSVSVRDLDTSSGWGFYYPITAINCDVDGAYGGYGHASCVVNCVANDCTYGFREANRYVGYGCIAIDCTTGFSNTSTTSTGPYVYCVADGCGTGFDVNTKTVYRSIATNCTTGYDSTAGSHYSAIVDCVGYGNTTDHNDIAVEINFTTLAADPWENRSDNDYRLNDSASGGQILRSKGYAYPTQTAATDANAFRTAASGSSTVVTPGPVQIGM